MNKIETRNLSIWYGDGRVLTDVNMKIKEKCITAIIGPSGCGKTTFIKAINRMIDLTHIARIEGEILCDGENIYDDGIDVVELRKKIGMVFQKPNPFPMSIYENVAYGPRVHGIKDRRSLNEIVEKSLREAFLWDEVKDRLNEPALGSSGGQQQRLCIARALSMKPEVILFDEPCSALDPISTSKIEDLIVELKKNYTVIIVTHNMQQAARISDYTAFFLTRGELIEYGSTSRIFERPLDKRTEDYITGRFG